MPSSPNVARRALLLLLLCPNAPAWCPGPPTARFASLRRTAATSGGDDAASGDDALSDTLLYIAQEAASRIKRNEAGADGASDEADGAAAAGVPTARSDRFQLVYTCGVCETRNLISVSRVSWTSGVVIATCHGCGRRHLLADNTGLLDTTNSTGFSNVEDLLAQRGEAVTRVSSLDDETLSEFFVQKKSDGAGGGAEVELMPQPGEQFQKRSARDGSLVATSATTPEPAPPQPVYTPTTTEATVFVGSGGALPDGSRSNVTVAVRYDDYLAKGSTAADGERGVVVALASEVADAVDAGDVLQVTTKFGLLQVPVPETFAALRDNAALSGPAARLQLRVEGALELTLPEGALVTDGETIEVVLPDGSGRTQLVSVPPGATAGSIVTVGFPVIAERAPDSDEPDDGDGATP